MHFELSTFTSFLKSIDLVKYREKYSHIKIVEMDLPKSIQALDCIYKVYWDKIPIFEKPLSFDDFYKEYYKSVEDEINEFWDKSGFGKDCDCFNRGLEARIYRTWASLITQIHAGYVAESVFGKDAVYQSTELDHKSIDILIKYCGINIGVQIKKESKRPEISRMYNSLFQKSDKRALEQFGLVNIFYIVPQQKDFDDPYYKVGRKGELRDSLKYFTKYNKDNATLDRFDNGFVVFTHKEFELIKNAIDSNKGIVS